MLLRKQFGLKKSKNSIFKFQSFQVGLMKFPMILKYSCLRNVRVVRVWLIIKIFKATQPNDQEETFIVIYDFLVT